MGRPATRRHDWKALVRARLGPLRVDGAREADIVDELAQHVAEHHKDLVRSGVADEEALELALRPLAERAGAELARADRPRGAAPMPPAESGGLLTDFGRDVRYAARLLRHAPAFTAVALVTLALGIGVNTAIFSVVNAVLLKPLPYADPDRLVMVGERSPDGSAENVGYMTFLDWRAGARGLEQLALIRSWQPTLVVGGEPERIAAMRVSANFFRTLGVRPALGRDFRDAEDTPSGWRVVMLGDGLWRRRFGADPAVVGRVLSMNDEQFTVIGVMPASFEPLISEHFYMRAEMWSLVGYDASLRYACRTCQHLKAIGRVRAGMSHEAARADIDNVQAELRRRFPSEYSPGTMTLVPLQEELTGSVRPALAVLMTAVVCVLLIACANIAHLLLARTAARGRDLALRAALGASRSRLVRQLLVESGLIAVAGGVMGVLASTAAVPLLVRLAPASMARLADARVDARVLAFSSLLSLATAFLFGLAPAIRASRVDLHDSLHGVTRKTAVAPTSVARRVLVAADVALACLLLIAAGLMIKSVGRLLAVNPGFDPEHVLTLQMSMVGQAYREDAAVLARTEEIVARLHALPGVEAVAAAGQIPLGGNGDSWGFHIDGRPVGPDDPSVERYSVTPGYFAVMRIPLLRGRLFTDADRSGAQDVMLIGEQTARSLWPNADPIGQRVRIGPSDSGPWRTIIGIVGDVRHRNLASRPTMQMYVPQAQLTDSFLTIVIRSAGQPATLASEARQTIWSVARDIPVYGIAPLAELVARSVAPRRFVMILLEVFSAVALLMTAVGVYGVISYSVAERTREIGIRTALGAKAADIVRLVTTSGVAVVSVGLAAGIVAALALTRYMERTLFEVRAHDPSTFVMVALVLFAVSIAAQAVPTVRALRIEPNEVLRQE